MSEGVALGGNLSDAVRVGDTVRRRAGPWTPAVHALLRHLEAVGFEGSPRVIGIDEHGREALAYIEGDGPTGWPDPMAPVRLARLEPHRRGEAAAPVPRLAGRLRAACAGDLAMAEQLRRSHLPQRR